MRPAPRRILDWLRKEGVPGPFENLTALRRATDGGNFTLSRRGETLLRGLTAGRFYVARSTSPSGGASFALYCATNTGNCFLVQEDFRTSARARKVARDWVVAAKQPGDRA